MQPEQLLRFGPYRLAPGTGQVWRGHQEVKVTPKAAAVLGQLVARGGQVVSKEELFRAVWPGTVVSDAALSSCIQELRRVLHDDARKPCYLATVHKRGFQFIGKVSRQLSALSYQQKDGGAPALALTTEHSPLLIVGREAELAQLHRWWEKARSGERQLVFVTGEPGIGKTTVVEAFLIRVASRPEPGHEHEHELWLGHGQCIEHYGAGEAYLPVLEALGRLGRGPDGQRLIAVLHRSAPTWLVQLPALLGETEWEGLQRKTAGATRERMLRELAEAVEALTADRALILQLEDLHWSDVSTLDWLAYVARRPERARLLIIGTYRPVDVLTREHPLKGVKQELQLHGQCAELALDFLTEAHVAVYLEARFSVGGHGRAPLQELAHVIHQRTDGNPLFMVTVTNELVRRGLIAPGEDRWVLPERVEDRALEVPETLRQLIERQLERLSPAEQRVLEVASAAGVEFSAAAVAAGVETEVEGIEDQCEGLARWEHFLRARGTAEWPDGTVAARYGFRHALYQGVLYHRLTTRRRQRLHQRIGEWAEAAYGERAREIAAELALHFERGRDYKRAIQYLQQAGENALRRSAHQEAINLLTQGLELLKTLPDTPERTQQELRLLKPLGPALISLKGYVAPEVEHTYARAYELCQQGGRPHQLIEVLPGLQVFYLLRGEVRKARDLAEQRLRLAQHVSTPTALMVAHAGLGELLFYLGELTAAREHLEQAWVLYNPQEHNLNVIQGLVDPGVWLLSNIALILWLLGYPDQAQKRLDEGLALAEGLSHPFSLAYALIYACLFHSFHQEWQRVRERAEEVITLSTEQGFSYWLVHGTAVRGRALAEQGRVEEGIAQMQQGLAFFRATGAELAGVVHLPWLAAAYVRVGRVEEGLAVRPRRRL